MLEFQGASHFRQRIVCSILSGKAIKITDIRRKAEEPGVQEFELCFLRFITALCSGCEVVISRDSCTVVFRPGLVTGGAVEFDCETERGIGYFLEAVLPLAPLAKQPFDLKLHGVTNDNLDMSVDALRTAALPLYEHFGVGPDALMLKVVRRGAPPGGGGLVEFTCPTVRKLKNCDVANMGLVKRIRGIAYTARVPPQTANRLVDVARGRLNAHTGNVFIYTDHFKASECGPSPGYGLTLVAETTTGCMYVGEAMAEPGTHRMPEDVGERACTLVLKEALRGGCVGSHFAPFALLMAVLGPEDVSRIRLGKLSPYTIQFLRHLKDFFGVVVQLTHEAESDTLIATVVGTGYTNMAKKVQ